ncbi:hypothetical protein SHI21_16480 [Bacteriovorax sp. PP10]|uniref:Uncharacterized protein n=1 Tax=Bacteriovorax antarcticus TaxID=3088717 RepID=A0ABU5VXP1_9BACT|nr:hypothetical protein [Bacteriovorax sp. PP10]MEA9357829.1 hypothetical protein [Bacteriovorax sp. PP10]
MSNYFKGDERLETFFGTGGLMRMGDITKLNVPDFEVLRNQIVSHQWDKALEYFNFFYTQNTGMIQLLMESFLSMPKFYAELTSVENEKLLRKKAITDYQTLIDLLRDSYRNKDDQNILVQVKNYFSEENLHSQNAAKILGEMEITFNKTCQALKANDESKALHLVINYHHQVLIYHDALITFSYSYPTTVLQESGEEIALSVCNGSIARNPMWNGMWELTKILTPTDLAAFLAEHLRFHFSGAGRGGQTQIVEDDKKIRLIFDPCGSGGALRRRLKDDVVNLQEKHQLGWNKCGEVNLYCSHCALNEKKSIEMFGYPKLVVEFQADENKPCGWTMYKDAADVPAEVYTRLGLKK